MPDAAVEATERQFTHLIRAVTPDVVVQFKLFSLAEVPRADLLRTRLAARYHDISEIWNMRLDGLIVTGTEPHAAKLADEPYWPLLRKLVAWSRENTASTIWSCLAAHAAVLEASGIERVPLEHKRFGVFDCEVIAGHPLNRGLPPRLHAPHSRHHDLPEAALVACDYQLISRSAAGGIDAFARDEKGASVFLFFQGHPEYEATTLLREYRRDIGRFLRGERESYPVMPQGYFSDEAKALATSFGVRAMRERDERLIADFPMGALEATVENSWQRSAVGIYRNWIDHLKERKAEGRAMLVAQQRGGHAAWRSSAQRGAVDSSSAR